MRAWINPSFQPQINKTEKEYILSRMKRPPLVEKGKSNNLLNISTSPNLFCPIKTKGMYEKVSRLNETASHSGESYHVLSISDPKHMVKQRLTEIICLLSLIFPPEK